MVLSALRQVPSVQIIRIGTRVPVVLPQRITDELCQMLRKYHPVWINTHFNHPQELTPEAHRRVVGSPMSAFRWEPVGAAARRQRSSADHRAALPRPRAHAGQTYYMYQCDLVRGVEHSAPRCPAHRNHGVSARPAQRHRDSHFVVDARTAAARSPSATYVVTQSRRTRAEELRGMLIAYPEPYERCQGKCQTPQEESAPGVWELTAEGTVASSREDAASSPTPGVLRIGRIGGGLLST